MVIKLGRQGRQWTYNEFQYWEYFLVCGFIPYFIMFYVLILCLLAIIVCLAQYFHRLKRWYFLFRVSLLQIDCSWLIK